MTAYIGTATSRVDGRDKVTGAAKYAGEFGAPDLAFASVVTSTIAKGRIARIDSSAAMKVDGVIAVLSHQNRPAMADNDEAYKDDVAPEQGSPFRPLYDERIHFSGQPIALVLAETSETARFAASLLHIDYDEEPHVTDVYRARDNALALDAPAKPRGDAAKAFAAADCAPRCRILYPDRAPQSDGAVRLDRALGWRRQAYGLRQDPGRAECAALYLQHLQHEAGGCPRDVGLCRRRVRLGIAAAISGGAGRAGGAGASALGARRAHTPADVWAWLSARHDPADQAGRESGRNTRRDHPPRDHGDIAIRGLPSPRNHVVRPALYQHHCGLRARVSAARSCDLLRHARPECHDRCPCARIRHG